MSSSIFPRLIGETWPVLKESIHNTQVQTSQAGMEVRVANWAQERYKWTLPFGYLNDDVLYATADRQILEGLFNKMHGRYDTFLYSDPNDNYVTASIFGTGDGTTTKFQLSRTCGASTHYIYNVDSSTAAPILYANGILISSGYSIDSAGLVTFSSAPGAGIVLTVDFHYYFRCRFDEDSLELTNECGRFWSIKQVVIFEVMGNQ